MFEGQGYPGETFYAREMRKWNTPKSQGGMRPDHPEEFPKMLYKARRPETGGPLAVINPRDERFSEANCLTVGDAHEEQRAKDDGWRNTPAEAIARAEAFEDAISVAAAERQNAEKRMSEKARAEAQAVDDATFEHVPEITPALVAEVKKRRGRPPKHAA